MSAMLNELIRKMKTLKLKTLDKTLSIFFLGNEVASYHN